MKTTPTPRQRISDLLCQKASFKQQLYEKAKEWMTEWKQVSLNIIEELQPRVRATDERVGVLFEDRNPLECMIKAGTDAVLLNMHSNIFAFPQDHAVWQNSYVKENPQRGFFAVFHLYNFLSDSVKYNRLRDQGILLCRVFVNAEGHFFIEGKKQLSVHFKNLAEDQLDTAAMRFITETVLISAIESDLTVPNFQDVMWVTIQELNMQEMELRLQTSKKIGYL